MPVPTTCVIWQCMCMYSSWNRLIHCCPLYILCVCWDGTLRYVYLYWTSFLWVCMVDSSTEDCCKQICEATGQLQSIVASKLAKQTNFPSPPPSQGQTRVFRASIYQQWDWGWWTFPADRDRVWDWSWGRHGIHCLQLGRQADVSIGGQHTS